MNVEQKNPESSAIDKKGSRGIKRADLSLPFFIFAGFSAAFVTGFSTVAIAYNPQGHSAAPIIYAYLPALLFFPCFLIALFRRRWASIPLWVCCALFFVMGLLRSRHPSDEIGTIQPGIGIFLIPALVEIARFIRSKQPKYRRSPDRLS